MTARQWYFIGGVGLVVVAVVAIMLLIKADTAPSPITETWSVAIPGAGVSTSLPILDCLLYSDDAILTTGLWEHPELIGSDGKVRWQFNPAQVSGATPGGESMHVAVGPDGWIYLGTNKNFIYAYDDQQQPVWRTELPGDRRWSAMPAVSENGTIYATSPGYVSALSRTGNMLWKQKVPRIKGTSAPVPVGADRVYVTSSQLELVALDAVGKELWRTAECTTGLDDLIVAVDGTVICPSRVRDFINAFNPDGTLRWNLSVTDSDYMLSGEWWVTIGPDDTVYYTEVLPSGENRLTALDISGAPKWNTPFKRGIGNPMVLPDGRIVVLQGMANTPGQMQNMLLNILKMSTNHLNTWFYVLDANGKVTDERRLDFMFTVLPPMLTSAGELLLVDEKGIMHAYQL